MDPATGNPARDKQLEDQFKSLYGVKPTRIMIMFPPVDRDIFFQVFNKRYGSSAMLKCRGDGNGSVGEMIGEATCAIPEYAQGLEVIGQNEMGQTKVKCFGPDCFYQQSRECHRVGSLQVLLPELDAVGVWQLTTGSYNSIVNMQSAIDWLIGMCGRYQMIPVPLIRMPQEIAHNEKGKQSKGTHYILQIDLQVSIASLQKAALIAPEKAMLALPEPEEGKDPIVEVEAQEDPQEEKKPDQVKKAEEVFGAKAIEMWDPGDLKRFGQRASVAEGLMKTVKKCYEVLGKDRFAYCLGQGGAEGVYQINSIEELSNFVNVLLSEKHTKEAEV